MSSKCPKCGEKLSPFYLKQTCPKCGINLMYYKLDERLETDAAQAKREVEAVERFKNVLKSSAVETPLHILRLILFFTPLLSMCLPTFYAGHKNVSLIGVILSIVNHGFTIGAWSSDYLFAFLAIVFVIVLSLAVIINSLFSSTPHGGVRNLLFSLLNTAVFGALSLLVCTNGGKVGAGFFVTLAIYAAELIFHLLCDKKKARSLKSGTVMAVALCVFIGVGCALMPKAEREYPAVESRPENAVVSFNLASPWGTPFDGTSGKARKERFVSYVGNYKPDLIGTQELNSEWYQYIQNNLKGYDGYAVKRGGDGDENTSEMNGIFWRKSKFSAIATDTFWLSDTPNEESRYTYYDENGELQEAGCNRICSYAILAEKPKGELLVFMNTHLDNSSVEAMNYGAELIVKTIGEIRKIYPDIRIVLTGDFNQTDEGEAYKIITSVLNDTTDKKKQIATWQDWGYSYTGDKPIDFIFTSGKGKSYTVLNDLSEGYVSDHYGIMAEIEY